MLSSMLETAAPRASNTSRWVLLLFPMARDHGMLTHRNPEPEPPARVVVLGARGFIGRTLVPPPRRAGLAALPGRRADLHVAPRAAACRHRCAPGQPRRSRLGGRRCRRPPRCHARA